VNCVIKKEVAIASIKERSIGKHLSSVIMIETIINTRNNNL